MSAKISKTKSVTDQEGDANIQIETSSYDDWLAKEGLASPHQEKFNLQMQMEDITSDGMSEKGEIDDKVNASAVDVENKSAEMVKNIKLSDKLDILTQEVQGMILQGEGEAGSQKRKSRLEMILQLLSDEKEDFEKTTAANESLICKNIMDKAEKPDSVTEVINPVKESSGSSGTPKQKPAIKSVKPGKGKIEVSGKRGGNSKQSLIHKINREKVDKPKSVTKVIKSVEDSSGTPKKKPNAKGSTDEKGKIEVSGKGGGGSVDLEESSICKNSKAIMDDPQSKTKVIKDSSRTPKKKPTATGSTDEKEKIEVSGEGGGGSVDPEELIHKNSTEKQMTLRV